MVVVKYIAIWALFVILWQIGGQFFKAARRYGIPLLVAFNEYVNKRLNARKLVGIAFLGFVLSIGYGEDSFIGKVARKLIKSEFWADCLTRFAYSVILLIGAVLINKLFIGQVALILAFQIRMGGFKIGKYDFLWEDFFRSSALFYAIYG